MSNDNRISAARLAEARIKLNLSQKELAEALSEQLGRRIPAVNVSAWERGYRSITPKYNDTLCNVLGVSLDFLTGKSNDLPENIKEFSELDEDYIHIELQYVDLFKYNGRPVYVIFKNLEFENGWALNDIDNRRFIFVKGIYNYTEADIKKNMRIYIEKPTFAINRNVHNKKCIEMASMLEAERCYVVPNSSDEYIRGLYTGWFHHNENRTCLINEVGLTLPYEGLGVTYKAYSSTNTFTVENIQ